MSDKYNIEDIINFSANENPLNVKQAVDSAMLSKIHSAIEGKKREVARAMFGGEAKDEPEWDDEEWEDEEDDDDADEDEEEDFEISDDDLDDLLSDLEDIDDVEFEDDETSDSEEE